MRVLTGPRLAAGRPRHRGAVAPRRRARRAARPGNRSRRNRSWRMAAARRRRRLPGRRHLRSRPAAAYSPDGYRRIVALGRELTALRAHLTSPAARADRRGAAGARRRHRSPRGAAGLGGLGRHRAARRVRRRGGRLRRPPRGVRAGSAGLPGCRRRRGERPGARRGDGRARPRPDPHRARRQGAGMAGGGRAAPERTGVPVHRVDAHLAHRRRRPAAAAARRPGHASPSMGCRCSTPPMSTIGNVVRQDL